MTEKLTDKELALDTWLLDPEHRIYGHRQSFRDGYDKGYVDGVDAGIKEMQHHEEQSKRLADLYEQVLSISATVKELPSKSPADTVLASIKQDAQRLLSDETTDLDDLTRFL